MLINYRLIKILILLFLVISNLVISETLILTDGTRVQGNVLEKNEKFVRIQSEDGTILNFNREKVKDIISDSKETIYLNKAYKEKLAGNYRGAIEACFLIIEENPNSTEAKKIINESFNILFKSAKEKKDKNLIDEVVVDYEYLRKIRQFYSADDKDAKIIAVISDLVDCYVKLSDKYLVQYKDNPEFILNTIDKAFEVVSEEKQYPAISLPLPKGKLYLNKGQVLQLMKKYPEAKEAYETALKYSLENNIDKIIAERRIKELDQLIVAVATPALETPKELIQPSESSQPVITPIPIATPAPTPVQIAQVTPQPIVPTVTNADIYAKTYLADNRPFLKKIIEDIKEPKKILNHFVGLAVLIGQGQYLEFVVGIPLFLLIFYILPLWHLRKLRDSGDSTAEELLMKSKLLGLILYIIYWIKRKKEGRQVKNRCPYCGKSVDQIESYATLNFYTCPHCNETITPIYSLEEYIGHLIKSLEKDASLAGQKKRKGGSQLDYLLEKDAMSKLIKAIVTLAARRRASDIHIEPETNGLKIRYRIDGHLVEMHQIPKTLALPIVSAIKVMANLDIAERRVPQDGRIKMWVDKADLDLRINTSPVSFGEKVSMRLLDIQSVLVSLEKLGFVGGILDLFEQAIRKSHGIIIVTGPTGSGKTSTLYVALQELNTGQRNIVTIEDPIEYQIKGINQMQVNVAQGFTFASGLRSILRQDPDIIMVGEIRDSETAEIAVHSATTGHLVMTTLHTIDAATAFTRLLDLGVNLTILSTAVNAIIAQRLIRLNCPECVKPYKPKPRDLEILGIQDQDIQFMKGTGCKNCYNIGYFGRTGIFEILVPDDRLRELLEKKEISILTIREFAKRAGIQTLRDEGVKKISAGLTTVEEVLSVIS